MVHAERTRSRAERSVFFAVYPSHCFGSRYTTPSIFTFHRVVCQSFTILIKGQELCERASAVAGGRNCSAPLSCWFLHSDILPVLPTRMSWSLLKPRHCENWALGAHPHHQRLQAHWQLFALTHCGCVEALWLYSECIQALVAKQVEAKWRLERGENAPKWTSTLHVNQGQERQALLQGDGQSCNLRHSRRKSIRQDRQGPPLSPKALHEECLWKVTPRLDCHSATDILASCLQLESWQQILGQLWFLSMIGFVLFFGSCPGKPFQCRSRSFSTPLHFFSSSPPQPGSPPCQASLPLHPSPRPPRPHPRHHPHPRHQESLFVFF